MAPSPPIGIVLAQFDDLFAGGLRELIESDPNLAILASGVSARRVPVVLRAHRPDVAVLDLAGFVPLAGVRDLSAAFPATRLVLLAPAPSTVEAAQVLAFGASACLGWGTQSRDLLHAIHLAARGIQMMGQGASGLPQAIPPGGLLTRREAEVLPLLRSGRSNAEIGATLNVGVETVRTHASNIYRKLGVASRRELSAEGEAVQPPARTPSLETGLSAHPGARRASAPSRMQRRQRLHRR